MWMRKGNAGQFSCRNLFWCFFCTLVNWPSEKHKHNNKIQKASLRQIKRPYKDVFRFHVSVHDVQWMEMFKSRTNVLGESQCKLFSLSSALVFVEQHFKISSRHELHHNRQLILNGDAFNHFHDFGMFCFPEETNTHTKHWLCFSCLHFSVAVVTSSSLMTPKRKLSIFYKRKLSLSFNGSSCKKSPWPFDNRAKAFYMVFLKKQNIDTLWTMCFWLRNFSYTAVAYTSRSSLSTVFSYF